MVPPAAPTVVGPPPGGTKLQLLLVVLEHRPVVASHVPAVWHASEAVQTTGLPPVHAPPMQMSVSVQALPSLQAVPSLTAGSEHAPVDGSQVPVAWHASEAVHTTELPPTQVPDWHVSVCVQAFPSLHAVPSGAVGFEQTPVAVLQMPAMWH
jgi:hypothetical protein